jgi:hypothetical protein
MPSCAATYSKSLRSRCASHVPDLRRRPDRKIDEEVGRAGGDLLREDRRDHLPLRVEAQRPLDRDQNVVGGREPRGAAPRDAAALLAHQATQAVERQLDLGEHLHGVGGAGGRSDRAARGLRDHHAVRRHDRDDEKRGAVAWNAADAMLVDDERLLPVEALAGVDHRAREREHLVPIHLGLPGGDQERADLGLGIAARSDVADDFGVVRRREAVAGDLAPHRVHRRGGFGVLDRQRLPRASAELGECLFRKTELARRDDTRVVDDVEDREHALAVRADFDLGQCLESLGPVDRALAVHVRDILAIGIDRNPPQPQRAHPLVLHGITIARGRRRRPDSDQRPAPRQLRGSGNAPAAGSSCAQTPARGCRAA